MTLTGYSDFVEQIKKSGLETAMTLTAEAGYDAIELLEIFPKTDLLQSTEDQDRLAALLQRHGLGISCLSVYSVLFDPEHPGVPNRAQIERLLQKVEFAARLGSPYVHHTLYPILGFDGAKPPFESVAETVVTGAVQVAKRAKELGVRILYEPQGLYSNGLQGFSQIYQAIREQCDAVGVCGDVANSYWVGEEPTAIFERFAKEIFHVHVKDYCWINGESTAQRDCYTASNGRKFCEAIPGTGSVPIDACLQILQKAGYRGAVSSEFVLNTPAQTKQHLQKLVAPYRF